MLAWLTKLGLEQYLQIFADNGIDLRALPHLTEQDFKDLGVLLGHRRILLAAIMELAKEGHTSEEFQTPESPVTVTGERRQVTILFVDLVGYTRLSSELDAEEIHTMLGFFLDEADRIIREYGGTVDKHVGDSVMAVFGAPVAHSNDAARAVRAALTIQQAMPGVSERAGRSLQVHAGIANGQVVASGVGSDAHYTVTGESVNLASRLTDIAKSDETVVSQGVRNAVAEAFELRDKGELSVKGVNEPVRAYAVTGLASTDPDADQRPFVGREAELQQFSAILEACRETRSGQVVYLRGEAGIGKTRLSARFLELAKGHGYHNHRALVLDFGMGKKQGVASTLTNSLLEMPVESSDENRVRRLDDAIEQGIVDAQQRVYLNALLGLPQDDQSRSIYDALDAASRERGKAAAFTALLARLTGKQPVLLFVEDIHWADAGVIEFLGACARTLADNACILLMTSRIEGDPLDHNWKAQMVATPLTTIDLRPLRPADAIRLAAAYIDTRHPLAQQCIERAEGNPLYLEQLLRSAEEMGEGEVPGSVHSIVQARLDSLPAKDKQAIQAVSVLGQRFSLDILRYMLDDDNYDCDHLVKRYLVKPEGEAFLFSHALVQEAVYQSLLKKQRISWHAAAADWYSSHEPQLYAHHLDRAADPGAARAYLAAAGGLLDELQFDTALKLVDRGLDIAQEQGIAIELALSRAGILRRQGEIEESIRACEALLPEAKSSAQVCRAWLELAEGLRIADRQQSAIEALESAQAAARESNLKAELSRIHYLRGNLYFMTGNIEGCFSEHKRSLALAQEADSSEGIALALGGLGDASYLRGHMRTARDQFLACTEECAEHGYGQIVVANRHMVGWSRLYLMEFSAAMEDACATIEMARKVGHQRAELIASELAATIELERGNFDASRDYIERSLVLARTLETGNFEAQAKYLLARINIAQGDLAEARRSIYAALEIVRSVGVTFIGPTVLSVCALVSENPEQSQALLAEAEDILDSGCVSHNYFHFARVAIEQCQRTKDWDSLERYAAQLAAYTAEEPLEWSNFIVRLGRGLAAWGRGERRERLREELGQLHAEAKKAGLHLVLNAIQTAQQE